MAGPSLTPGAALAQQTSGIRPVPTAAPTAAALSPGAALARGVAPGQPAAGPSGGGGLVGSVEKYSGEQLFGNLLHDIGSTATQIPAGVEAFTAPTFHQAAAAYDLATGNTKGASNQAGAAQKGATNLVTDVGKQYADYYGHDLAHHVYTHPLQPILDALTVADLGSTAGARLGVLDEGRASLLTRSPRNIATGKGPVTADISATKPIVKYRQILGNKIGAKFPEGVGPGPVKVGGELKAYGKQIQAQANQNALSHLAGFSDYQKATRGLRPNDWAALHIRAMDIHPDDLAELWKGKPAEKIIADPAVRKLVLEPTPRLLKAETAARSLSEQGGALFKNKGFLKDETAAARPAVTKAQASEVLGHPVKDITGKPYYFPHTPEPVKPTSPLAASGGGKGVPKTPGTLRQNTGALALGGKLHLRSDILGPDFLRRVKFIKYDEIHNGLVRGAVRVTDKDIDRFGGKLPQGWEYVREKPKTVNVEKTVSAEPDANQMLIPGAPGATKTVTERVQLHPSPPVTARAEGEHIPIGKLIPNAEDLHDSQLARDGFSTKDQARAHTSGGKYYIVPTRTAKAATGEFTRSGDFVHAFVSKPLSVWRSLVLGLRPGFLTNNLVGNSLMYAVKTGGQGALRDLFGAIRETHGTETALKVLKNQATPPDLRVDLYKEFFPEQVHGTFGRTQSPSTSLAHAAGQKGSEAFRTVTGALPKATSKVAEEFPRRALVRHYIRHSPEFRQVYKALPKQTRTFENAARQVLEGKGSQAYQRLISKQVNDALGDYLHLSPAERNVLRNLLPFYSWYRAIATTTYHLAADTPLRANVLGQLGRIGKEQSDQAFPGGLPSFLQGALSLGNGPDGTQKILSTQGLNPYSTLEQLRRGGTSDIGSLGLNPVIIGALQAYGNAAEKQHTYLPHVSPAGLVGQTLSGIVQSLPPAQLLAPPPPSKLYPKRSRRDVLFSQLGIPIKNVDPAVAALQASQGR